MRILIINGSPKGENSITLQTMLFIQKHFPNHEYEVIHAGQRIKALEKDFSEEDVSLKDMIERFMAASSYRCVV